MRSHARILTVLLFALMAVSVWQVANLATDVAAGSKQPLALAQAPPSGAYFDHVIIILMENQGVYDICRSSPPPCSTSGPAPYMAGLANTYGIGSQYLSLINTSQPNYIALIGGSTLGCTSSGCPTITAPNLVDRFESAGLSWKGYFENQNVAAGCDGSSHEPYEPIHNPFISFQDISTNPARCNQLVLANPTTCGSVTDCVLINDLNSGSAPNFIWLTPNDCNDMRGASGICSASISAGDNYLKGLVPNILNSNTFKTGRSALFITFDEGNGYCPLNGSSESCVYSVWAGPAAKTSFGTANLYNHYSFPKTIETNWNLATLSTGDGSATPMAEFFNPTSPSPDFAISASPTSLSINAGSSSTSTITLTSLNNFAGTVALSTAGSPAGLALSLNPASVSLSSGGTGASTLSVSSSNPGSYTVTITGTSGSLSHSTTVQVSVASAADFSIFANPTTLNFNAGSTATSTITLTSLNNFAGTVTLSPTSSPAGLSLSANPTSVSLSAGGTGTSTLSVSSSNPGTYTVTITAISGSLSHQTTVTVNIADYSLTASPTSIIVTPGSSATSTVSLKSLGGFAGTITLSPTSSPAGLTPSLSSSTVTLSSGGTGTTTLTISTQASTPAGNYTVTITGSSGSLSHSTTVQVSVRTAPDFSIVANPASLTLQGGASSSSTITVTSFSGFSGTVTLTDSLSPATSNPPVLSLSTSSLTLSPGGSTVSTLTITTSTSTTPGTYAIQVTGTSGSLTHSASLSLTVAQSADFTLASGSPTVNILAGSSGTSTITATSIGGFSGAISLSLSAGTGLTASVSPTSLALTSGGTAASTLTVSSNTIGNYSVTVTGTSGSQTHSVSVRVIVSDFSISVNPSALSLPRGASGSSLITLTSLNGFTGTITLSTTVSPTSGPRTNLSSPSVTLTSGGQSTSTLNVRVQHKTPIGSYTVTVTGTSGSVSHSVTITVNVTA